MIERKGEIDAYLKRLFPICRSITGKGNRETLKVLQEIAPITIKEYPSGMQAYDWTIPREWNIRDAWIKNSRGEKLVNFQNSNLHVVNYSIPVHKKVAFSELNEHLHWHERLPDAIPYRTSYYRENWGFCVSYNGYRKNFREDDEYEVYIDSSLEQGSLSIGELLVPGKTDKEYLLSTYFCHPSLANDNLSGTILTAFLARELLKKDLHFSYRIIFVPETIGAIAYCAQNEAAMKKIDCGFVITTVGGPGKFSHKQSYNKDHMINRIVEDVFRESGVEHITYPFDIHGSDERQYSSIGFRINATSICKDKYYEYDCYHTSRDDLSFISPEAIDQSLELYVKAIDKLDKNILYANMSPHCEIMLSKHDLYPKTGGGLLPTSNTLSDLDVLLWLLFYADGKTALYEIAGKLRAPLERVYSAAELLASKGILKR